MVADMTMREERCARDETPESAANNQGLLRQQRESKASGTGKKERADASDARRDRNSNGSSAASLRVGARTGQQAQPNTAACCCRCCCWPASLASCGATTRVADRQHDESNRLPLQALESSSANTKANKQAWSVFNRTGRSDSLEVELKRIRMHERLLLGDQQKLFIELNRKLAVAPAPTEIDAPLEVGSTSSSSYTDNALVNFGSDLSSTGANAAIECKNVRYSVRSLSSLGNRIQILNNISLSVPEGSIYGLLGPSGCGKTTMLRCVAGRLKTDSGSIKVFGYEPNDPASQIPGPAIGYMPQELSIYEEFTIRETLIFFGRINRVKPSLLKARIDFLLKFLDLPQSGGDRLVKSLSGGQKRRVSLAAALVHAPPLLVLDEPTVGVDPLLRQVIWRYLVALASREKITIVITTHYIEEARQANIVALMRDGKMLAEDEPNALMQKSGQVTLENVFLKLCLAEDSQAATGQKDKETIPIVTEASGLKLKQHRLSQPMPPIGASLRLPETSTTIIAASEVESEATNDSETTRAESESGSDNPLAVSFNQKLKPMKRGDKYAPGLVSWAGWFSVLSAMIWKNYLRLKRNPPVLAFEFILPAFQVILFCLCIGGDPHDIKLAIVNEELVPQASRLFLNAINNSTFIQVPFANLSSAIESVERAETWAAVHIPAGFTKNLNERLLQPTEATSETVANSTIKLYPDLTNLHLALAIEGAFREAFMKFTRDSLRLLGYEQHLAELPIKIERPIYGRLGNMVAQSPKLAQPFPSPSLDKPPNGYLEFMAPGVIISIVYVMATGLTALAFVLEKRDGLLERSQVSGVTTSQILLAHGFLQLLVMIFQIALVLWVSFYVFRIPSRGPLGWALALVLLQGCAGMSYGLLISAICNEENTAVMMLVGTFYVNLILAGIIWPVEAMPFWLQLLSYAQPQTIPTDSLRCVLSRGWSISSVSVQLGLLISAGWLALFLLGAGLCMHYVK